MSGGELAWVLVEEEKLRHVSLPPFVNWETWGENKQTKRQLRLADLRQRRVC
jgi:hypothetical protein